MADIRARRTGARHGRTAILTVGGVTRAVCRRNRTSVSRGSSSAASRKLIFAAARAGIIPLTPGPVPPGHIVNRSVPTARDLGIPEMLRSSGLLGECEREPRE
jgi:hypothetical protein